MNRKITICYLVLLLVILQFYGCNKNNNNMTTQKIEIGQSEIIFSSDFVKKGDWIFFINRDDENKLYKMKSDFTENQKVMDYKVIGTIIIDKNSLYFSESLSNLSNKSIVKVNLDDLNQSTINLKQEAGSTSSYINLIAIQDQWIYFQYLMESQAVTYRIMTDGSNLELVLNGKTKVFLYRDWIFYNGSETNKPIYRMKKDGSEKAKISASSSNFLVFDKDWIYYSNLSDKGRLYKMNIDGKESISLTSYEKKMPLFIHDDWIYYQNEKLFLFKMKTDESIEFQLTFEPIISATNIEDWIFYTTAYLRTFYVSTNGVKRGQLIK